MNMERKGTEQEKPPVKNFNYLGVIMLEKGDLYRGIKERVTVAVRLFYSIINIFLEKRKNPKNLEVKFSKRWSSPYCCMGRNHRYIGKFKKEKLTSSK